MHKLKQAVAFSDDIYIAPLTNPFEQDLKNSQPPLAQDRAWPDYYQRERCSLANLPHGLLTGKFGSPINFRGAKRRLFCNWTRFRNAKDRGGTHVDKCLHPRSRGLVRSYTAAFDIHF